MRWEPVWGKARVCFNSICMDWYLHSPCLSFFLCTVCLFFSLPSSLCDTDAGRRRSPPVAATLDIVPTRGSGSQGGAGGG